MLFIDMLHYRYALVFKSPPNQEDDLTALGLSFPIYEMKI